MTSNVRAWRLCVVTCIALGTSCGSDDPSHEPDGFYGLITPDGCQVVFSFHPKEEKYGVGLYCELESGAIGAQAQNGNRSGPRKPGSFRSVPSS